MQRVGCTTVKCNSNKVGKSPAATRCDGDAMRRCDGDATAQKLAQKQAQKPAQYMQVFRAKIQKDSDTYSSRYFLQNTYTWLHIGTSGLPTTVPVPASMLSYKCLPRQVYILLSQLQIHANSDSCLQIVKCRYWIPSCHYWISTAGYQSGI